MRLIAIAARIGEALMRLATLHLSKMNDGLWLERTIAINSTVINMFLSTVFWLPNEFASEPNGRRSLDDKGLLEMVPTKHMLQCDRRAKGEAHVSQDKFGVEDQAARQTRDPSHRAGLARFVMHAFVREMPKAIVHLLTQKKRGDCVGCRWSAGKAEIMVYRTCKTPRLYTDMFVPYLSISFQLEQNIRIL